MPVVNATHEAIRRAAEALRAGSLVAFPTETVYGLGADARQGRAVARIFEVKGRPRFNPLIVHCADLAGVERVAHLGPTARLLAERFWPGPLTLVLAKRADAGVSDLVTAGLDTVAVRVPDHPVARALLAASGLAVAAPSANRSGHVSPTTAAHVLADFGEAPAYILDAGPTAHGLESTILDVSGDRVVLLRSGAVTAEDIDFVLAEQGLTLERGHGDASELPSERPNSRPNSPGQLASHYAPRARLRLDATATRPGEALLAFGPSPPACSGHVLNLSASGDLIEAAAGLFAALRALDAAGADAIAVMPIPDAGLGEAINDRLRRAAAPRS